MKRKCAAAAAAALLLGAVCPASAAEVQINGAPLVTDAEPVIISERTFVPMRAIFEAFGAEVDWLGEEQIIAAASGSKLIMLKIGSDRLIVKDIESDSLDITELDAPPVLIGDRTMVPVRAVSEALGASVAWDDETRTVIIEKEEPNEEELQ